MIILGDEVKDKITGFKGIAVGKSEHINGCIHICVQPKVCKSGELPEDKWIDEPQLIVTKTKKKKIKRSRVGGPMLNSKPRF